MKGHMDFEVKTLLVYSSSLRHGACWIWDYQLARLFGIGIISMGTC